MNPSKTVLVSGASGLIGSALCDALRERGHAVRTLSRSNGEVHWDLEAGSLESGALDGIDAVIHLAGEPIAQRWNQGAKQRILDSRVKGTRLLAEGVAACEPSPAFICASGVNYYGFNADQEFDENSPSGNGFLAKVCRQWEAAAQPARDAGSRTVFMRTGVVLSSQGGALAKMLPAFKIGAGGRIGEGWQRMSWISLPDLVNAYIYVLENEALEGAINAVAPEPINNQEFTKALGSVLGRPTVFRLPKIVVAAIFGEMSKETVLADLGVRPQRLLQSEFKWSQPEIKAALQVSQS